MYYSKLLFVIYQSLLLFSITKCIAMDCEMVGAGTNRNNQYDMLARCSIVNCYGNVVYDKYVTPVDNVVDYRTKYSGITDKDLRTGTIIVIIIAVYKLDYTIILYTWWLGRQ